MPAVRHFFQVLAKVEEANQIGRQLPPDAFYNELIRCVPLPAFLPLVSMHAWTPSSFRKAGKPVV